MLTGEELARLRRAHNVEPGPQRTPRANLRTVTRTRHLDLQHIADTRIDPIIRVLISVRLDANLSAEALSIKSVKTEGVPISATTIRKWERGASSPSLAFLRRWCELLEKNLEQICATLG